MRSFASRLSRLERTHRQCAGIGRFIVQYGYLAMLPEYVCPRHIATVRQLPSQSPGVDWFEWEERPGPRTCGASHSRQRYNHQGLLHRSAARPLPITVHNAQLTSPVWRSAAPIAILSHSARDGSARPPWVQSVATIEFPGKKRQHLSMVFHFLLRTLAAVILRGLLRIHQAYPRQRELLPQVALVAVDRIYFERPLRLVPDISRHVAAYAEHSGC